MKLVSNFAERLKLALELRNMKATKLSELTNVNKSTISQYLSGEYASANRIHDILNISLSYTYTLVKNNKVRSRIKNGRTEYNMEDFL
ncbi:hypothetical protein HMPREF9093_01501 [Fusobacterium sp. oral taxon 370 str. F0437]|nr:hypothetical protein HMPREF9093_01501 [Fusobacterium sp. oral taxon 370 str. F0437]